VGQGISAHEILADIPAWEAMLARHAETFAPLLPGCTLALVPKADTERRPGRMLVWERSGGDGMKAEVRPFTGYKGCGVDILFAAEEQGLAAIHRALPDRPLGEMKAALRRGELFLFVMKSRDELIDAGWDEFLETLGLAYLGACR
jgi:hypothetical protein